MSPNQPKTPMRSFRCDDALWDQVRELAEKTEQTVTDVVRAALEAYVARKN